MAPISHHRLESSLPVDEPLYEYSSILCGKHLMRGSDFEGVRKQISPLSFKKKHDVVRDKGVHPLSLWGLWPQFDTL